jgi:hypothetical protein
VIVVVPRWILAGSTGDDMSSAGLDPTTGTTRHPHGHISCRMNPIGSINFGAVPDWLGGAGAVLALLWAKKAAKAATRTAEQLEEQIKAQQLQWNDAIVARQREQDEKVAAWIEFHDNPLPEGQRTTAAQVLGTYFYYLRNASDLPIYEVQTQIMPPSSSKVHSEKHSSFQPVVAPNDTAEQHKFAENSHLRSYRIELQFRDASGRCWRRDHFGVLRSRNEISYLIGGVMV